MKSVVFRIETGGGSSLAADVILREAMLTAQKKPLIVSMGTSAASGGYYASVGAREIFANRGTVTGSIGIFYGKADVAGLLDKLGVHDRAVPHRAARRRRVALPPLHGRREARARPQGEAVLRPVRGARRGGAAHVAGGRRRRRARQGVDRAAGDRQGPRRRARRPAPGARRGAAAGPACRPTRPSSSRPRRTTRCSASCSTSWASTSARRSGMSALPQRSCPSRRSSRPSWSTSPTSRSRAPSSARSRSRRGSASSPGPPRSGSARSSGE